MMVCDTTPKRRDNQVNMSDTPATLVTGGTESPSSATTAVHGHSHGHHSPHFHEHTGRRLREFFRPDGRKVHVASSPEEANTLRKTLSAVEDAEKIDCVIHGSPEHLEALRHAHTHHEDRHRRLQEQHGDLAREFERVIRELDALSTELHMISEHAVQLDANFSKYGYGAHLRTHDSNSDAASSSGNSTFDKNIWAAERKLGTFMHFYEKPIVRQYFHKGLLWRAKEAQEVASYELFIDLFYVGIIAITGDTAAEHPNAESLLRFAITFIMGWKLWSDINWLVSWFDSDDILRRFTIMFILACLLGFTTNMASAFEHTYTPLIAFYLTARLYMTVSMLWYAWIIPMVRGSMIGHSIMSLIPAALWIGSIHVEEPGKQGLIWVAIVFDLLGSQFIMMMIQRPRPWLAKLIPQRVKQSLEFFPGTNIEHRIERTNAFVTLVFGSSVLGLLYQSNVPFGINAFYGKAVLGLIQAFVFNWIYFEIDSFNLHTHAIRRSVLSAQTWFTIHLPFIMSFVLSASALALLVVAHDCADAPIDTLPETYIAKSEEHISSGLQWYYCGGLGVSLFCLAIIALSNQHRKIPNQRVRKETRLVFRMVVAVIIITLPTAHMNSLQLVATATGLVISVLALELVGSSCWGDNIFWNKGCTRAKATYSAKCGVKKEELQKCAREGTVLDVEEIARRGGGEKGIAASV